MRPLYTLALLCLFSTISTAQTTLWQYLNNNAYYLSGNVGLNIINPTERLQVDGNVWATAFRTSNIVMGSQTPEVAYRHAASTIGTYKADQSLYLQSPNDLFFHTGVLEDSLASMTILRNGRVGVGTLSPTQALSIAANNQFAQLKLERTGEQAGATFLGGSELGFTVGRFESSDEAGDYTIDLTVDTTGKVGIGTTEPISALHIASTQDAAFDKNGGLVIGATDHLNLVLDNNEILARMGTEKSLLNLQADGGDVRIYQNGPTSEKIVFKDNGSLGFGTTNPMSTLHIAKFEDASLEGDGGLVIGTPNHWNLVLDDNEIMARTSNAISTLYLQGEGGELRIHNNRPTSERTVFKGDGSVGIGTTSPAHKLQVNGSAGKPGGGNWTNVSDKRLKKNIKAYEDGLEQIMQIRPVRYHYNGKLDLPSDKEYVGIIAQEIQEVAPYMVGTFQDEEKGEEYLDFDGSALTFMLINAVQEQEGKIESLESEIEELKALVHQLLQQQITNNTITTQVSNAELKQNEPNPFTSSTTIPYFIPKTVQKAVLQITNSEGKLIEQIAITDTGHGQIVLDTSHLGSGSYWYSLILDGKVFAARQMLLAE